MRALPLVLLCACGADYEIVLVLPDADAFEQAIGAELAISSRSSCPVPVTGEDPEPEETVKAVSWRARAEPPDIGELDPGSYAMYARVRSEDCRVRWAGCTVAVLEPDGEGRIEIALGEVAGPGCLPWQSCDESGRCLCGEGETCASTASSTCCREGCVDLGSDPRNCSGCGVACPGIECAAGACVGGRCTEAPVPLPDGTQCADGGACQAGRCSTSCTPGDRDSQTCDLCGTQSRTCGADGQWSTWGQCEIGGGECTPGDFQSEECGNCGTMSRTCGEDCSWSAQTGCVGEGACQPGESEEAECGECGTQERTCTAECAWAATGSCDNRPGRADLCDDDDGCTTDSCSAEGQCQNDGCQGSTPVCCGVQTGCRECCGNDATSCDDVKGSPGLCRQWSCSNQTCSSNQIPDGTDPNDDCTSSRVCCSGECVECCDDDVTPCGPEGRCADWTCSSASCRSVFETNDTDPENECAGADTCNGAGCCILQGC